MIKLKEIPPPTATPIYSATLHKSGKIGLAIETAKHFGLDTSKGVKLYINELDSLDLDIYAVVVDGKSPEAYKITKSGPYHTINSKDFFDKIKRPYKTNSYFYLVSKIKIGVDDMLKFKWIETKGRDGLPF